MASFAIPAGAAAWLAGDSMGFLDAPELASAAQGLGVTHPPGHPLWVALASLFTLLPVGTVAFRVALLSSVCLGLTGRFAYAIARSLAAAVDPASVGRRILPALALSAALTATLGPAVFGQATRTEVYALATMLAIVVLALAALPELSPAVTARGAVLALALGGANHHFIALTALPLGLWVVGRRMLAGSWTARRHALESFTVLGAVGLGPYVLLPMRGRAVASLIRVRTLGDFVWTVSAQAFQKNTGGNVPGSFGTHILDVLDWIGSSVSPIGIMAAMAGAWIAVRRGASRPVLACVLLAVVGSFARAWLGFVRDNPDAAGYLGPAIVSVAILGVGFTVGAARIVRLSPAPPEGPTPTSRTLLYALLVGLPALAPGYVLTQSVWATAVDRSHGPEAMADATLAPLPVRTAVLAYNPDTVFRLRYATLVEGERPDVTVVPVPFLPYPGTTNAVLGRDDSLLPLIRDFLSHGAPRIADLADLAAARPVSVELDPHNLLLLVPWVLPHGVLAAVQPEPTTLSMVRATTAAHFAAIDALTATLRAEPSARGPSDTYLLWCAYNDAMFLAARGARAEARLALHRGLAIAPQATELIGLAAALATDAQGPLDVRPYLVGSLPP